MRYSVLPLIILFCAAIVTGCARQHLSESPSSNNQYPEQAGISSLSSNEYVLQSGDVLEIKFYYNPELNEVLPIRPDGMISLQLVDEVKAAGLTPSQLDKLLTEKYSKIFLNPEISVIVKEFSGYKAYVGGEVKAPGIISVVGGPSVLQAIVNAGGFTEAAQPASVIIIRKDINNNTTVRKVNLSKVLSGESVENDIVLMPFDIVYVPKSLIANVNKFVDQYINNIVPDFVSVGFSYTRYRGKQTGTIKNVPVQ
jgi:protein involved in polysaccharide export with SLBB domain